MIEPFCWFIFNAAVSPTNSRAKMTHVNPGNRSPGSGSLSLKMLEKIPCWSLEIAYNTKPALHSKSSIA